MRKWALNQCNDYLDRSCPKMSVVPVARRQAERTGTLEAGRHSKIPARCAAGMTLGDNFANQVQGDANLIGIV